MTIYLKANADDVGRRLDSFVREKMAWPQSKIQKLIRQKDIKCNDAKTTADYRLHYGDTLRIREGNAEAQINQNRPDKKISISRADISLLQDIVLYEDDGIIAINKPNNLASQGGSGIIKSIDQMMLAWWEKEQWAGQPRLIHRLDQPTTGVLIMAKTRIVAEAMSKQIREHKFIKEYEALVYGVPYSNAGTINAPLLANQGFVTVHPDGQLATTNWSVIKSFSDQAAHLLLQPQHGRMHQLRVHCMTMGHPIIGDRKYGRFVSLPFKLNNNLHLHAAKATFTNPATGELQTITAPLPTHIQVSINVLSEL